MDLNRASRYLSYLLRHHPEAAGITLDAHGWADVDQLLAGMKKHRITRAQLEEIVAADQKQRYAFDERRTKIRANQGHSIAVDVELRECEPPARLWHGSAKRFAASIAAQGLRPMNRLYVHLSTDVQTARKVGARHGEPIVYEIDCAAMRRDAHVFYLSQNGVWLIKQAPYCYMKEVQER